MAANNEIFNRSIRHLIGLEKVKDTLDRQVVKQLNAHSKRLDTLILNSSNVPATTFINSVKREVVNTYQILEVNTSEEINSLVSNEVKFQKGNLGKPLKNISTIKTPSATRIRTILNSRSLSNTRSLIGGNRSYRQWMTRIGKKELNVVQNTIRRELIKGTDVRGIAKAVQVAPGGLATTKAQARTLTRTYMTNMNAQVNKELILANSDVVSDYIWVSTLDTRTSSICQARDGKQGRTLGGAIPPAHFNCRSTIVPYTKPLKDLRLSKRKLNSLPATQRAALDGQIPAAKNYSEWLGGQTLFVQSEVLGGLEKATLFNRGRVVLSKFVNTDGKRASLYTLKKLDDEILSGKIEFNKYKINTNAPKGTYDITYAPTSNADIINIPTDELARFISFQGAKGSNTAFSRSNFTNFYREWLDGDRKFRFLNKRWSDIIDDYENLKVIPFDSRNYEAVRRRIDVALKNKVITQKQKDYILKLDLALKFNLEGNQRTQVLNILLDVLRNDNNRIFNPLNRNINGFFIGAFNNKGTISKFRRAISERGTDAFTLNIADEIAQVNEIGFTTANNKLILQYETIIKNKATGIRSRVNARFQGIFKVPKELSTITSENILEDALLYLGRNTIDKRGAHLVAEQLGGALYKRYGITVSATKQLRLGETLLDSIDRASNGRLITLGVTRRDPIVQYITNRAGKDIATKSVNSEFVYVSVVDNDFTVLSRFYRQRKIKLGQPRTPRSTSTVKPGQTNRITVTPENDNGLIPVNKRQADVLNAAKDNSTASINNDVFDLQDYLYQNNVPGKNPIRDIVDTKAASQFERAIETARNNLDTDLAWNWSTDFRKTRIYPVESYFSTTGLKETRAIIDFNKTYLFNDDAFEVLLERTGNIIKPKAGEFIAGRSTAQNIIIGKSNQRSLEELGELIITKKFNDVSVHNLFVGAKEGDRFLLARRAVEFARIRRHINSGKSINTYRSKIGLGGDVSSSNLSEGVGLFLERKALNNLNIFPRTSGAGKPRELIIQEFSKESEDFLEKITKAVGIDNLGDAVKNPTLVGSYNAGIKTQLRDFNKVFTGPLAELDNVLTRQEKLRFINAINRIQDRLFGTQGTQVFTKELIRLQGKNNARFYNFYNESVDTIKREFSEITVKSKLGGINSDVKVANYKPNTNNIGRQETASTANVIQARDGIPVDELHLQYRRLNKPLITNHDEYITRATDYKQLKLDSLRLYIERNIDVKSGLPRNYFKDNIDRLLKEGRLDIAGYNKLNKWIEDGVPTYDIDLNGQIIEGTQRLVNINPNKNLSTAKELQRLYQDILDGNINPNNIYLIN